MRNKTSLILMEQLAMVLVFALVSAMCLQIFVFSDRLSKDQEAKANAALIAQNTAELLKNRGSARSETSEESGWWMEDGMYVQIYEEKTEIPGLVCARIAVSDGTKTLFEIPVAWQEVTVRE